MSSDTELNFRPALVGAALFVLIVNLIPKIITKPTGIKIIDDLVMYLLSIKDSLLPGSIVAALVVFGANYIDTQVL
jgi:uncharacterized membrane protein